MSSMVSTSYKHFFRTDLFQSYAEILTVCTILYLKQQQRLNTVILWSPDAKSWLIRKDPDAGKDWWRGEKGTTESEMIGWTQWTWVWANSGRQWRTGKLGVCAAVHGVTESQAGLSNRTTTAARQLFTPSRRFSVVLTTGAVRSVLNITPQNSYIGAGLDFLNKPHGAHQASLSMEFSTQEYWSG